MKLKNIYQKLIESRSTPIIVVDVQPAYDKFCNHLIGPLCTFLNTQSGKIMIMFNGEDLDLDPKSDVIQYYLDNGLDGDKISNIIWTEKIYGYFRDYMDSGIDVKHIKMILREMIINKINDSRDLPEDYTQMLYDKYDIDVNRFSPIYIPDISVSLLRQFKNCYIMGGGKDECLREITIFLNALNINYKEMRNFIY